MPTSGEARPDPKARTLARGPRKYRRKVASPKQWQAIQAAKIGPCRVCVLPYSNGQDFGKVQLHHLVFREDGGDDVVDNIVPLHVACHVHVLHGRARRRGLRGAGVWAEVRAVSGPTDSGMFGLFR